MLFFINKCVIILNMEYKLRHQIREIFRKYMFDNDLNQTKIADKLGINESVISQIIHEKTNLSIDRLEEYLNKLDIEIEINVK